MAIKLGGSKKPSGVDSFMVEWINISQSHPFNHRARIYKGAAIEMSPFGKGIHLSDILSLKPGSGDGTKAMKGILQLADKHRVTIEGTAKAYVDKGQASGHITDTKDLAKWYKKLGFKVKPNYDDSYEIRYN